MGKARLYMVLCVTLATHVLGIHQATVHAPLNLQLVRDGASDREDWLGRLVGKRGLDAVGGHPTLHFSLCFAANASLLAA